MSDASDLGVVVAIKDHGKKLELAFCSRCWAHTMTRKALDSGVPNHRGLKVTVSPITDEASGQYQCIAWCQGRVIA